MSSSLNWSLCTPYTQTYGYDSFHSLYKNLRYQIKNYTTYKVTSGDVANLPGISFNVYGTVNLWRVILEFNGLSDPINDVQVGINGDRVPDVALYSDKFNSFYKESTDITAKNGITIENSTAVTVETEIEKGLGADVRSITRNGLQGQGAAMFIRGCSLIHSLIVQQYTMVFSIIFLQE